MRKTAATLATTLALTVGMTGVASANPLREPITDGRSPLSCLQSSLLNPLLFGQPGPCDQG